MVRTDVARRGVPWVGLLLEHGRAGSGLNLGWRHRLSAVASLALAGGLLVRRPSVAVPGAVALVALNRDFYALLLARGGPGFAATGASSRA